MEEIKKERIFKNPRYILGRTPYQAFECIYFLYAILTIIFTELFEGEVYQVLPFDIIGDYIGFLLTCLMLGLILLFIAKKYFYVKVNYFFLIILSIMFIGNSIALITFPNEIKATTTLTGQPFVYSLENIKKYEYLFMFLNSCLFLYVTYVCVPVCRISKSFSKNIAIIFLIVTYFAIIFSYFSDYEQYHYFFRPSDFSTKPGQIKSFIGEKNMFGMLLFLAMIVHFKFLYETRNYFNLFMIVFLYAHIIVCECRSAALAGIVLFLGYFIIVAIEQLHNKKAISIAIFSLLGLGVILLALIVFVPAFSKIVIFKKIANVLKGSFVTKADSTFYSRLRIWDKFFTLVNSNPIFFIFGLGTMNFNYAFLYAKDNNPAMYWHLHNGFLEPFGQGGIIRFIINLIFVGYILYLVIALFIKTKDKRLLLYLTFLLAFFTRTVFEPEFLLSTSLASIISIISIALPIFTYKAHLNSRVYQRKPSIIISKKIEIERLFYLLPTALISTGILTNNLYIRIGLILVGFIIQVVSYFSLMKKKSYIKQDERKFREFSFIMILDIIISLESIICLYLFSNKIDVAHYLYNILFAYCFSLFFYYFANEYSLLDDEFAFIKRNELEFEKKSYDEIKKDEKAIINSCFNKKGKENAIN